MNKKFLLAWLVVFLLWLFGSWLIHGVLLHADYAKLPNLFRPEEEAAKYGHLMLLAHILMAGAFVWLYSRGVEKKSWVGQGLRFGLAIALLAVVPTYLIYYVVQPMPGAHVAKQIIYDGLLVLLLGLAVAFVFHQCGKRGK